MNKHSLVSILLLLLVYSSLFSQSSDFIVLSHGDTLYGEVIHLEQKGASTRFARKLTLISASSKKRRLKQSMVAAFRVEGTDYERFQLSQSSNDMILLNPRYDIDPVDGEITFLQVVSKGCLRHYRWQWWEQGESLAMSMELLRKEADQYFIRADQGLLGLKRKTLSKYFKDCSDLSQKVANKELNEVREVVAFYNENCPE